MANENLAVVILAGGQGSRMKSKRPKVLHRLAGRSILSHVVAVAAALKPKRIVAVVPPAHPEIERAAQPAAIAVQRNPRGTGHAVQCGMAALAGFKGTVLVLLGDVPLITLATLRRVLRARRGAAVVVLGFRPKDAARYGRMLVDRKGNLTAIVEYKDTTAEQRAIDLCNSGVMAIEGAHLADLLAALSPDNAQREYLLTDIVKEANRRGLGVRAAEGAAEELPGINSRSELAAAEALFQARLRQAVMAAGATLVAPETVMLSYDTRLGRDCIVGPFVVFGPGVRVAEGAEIRAFSHLEGASIGAGALVGPYARLRPGAVIGKNAHIGNFVEVKQAQIGAGAKANHLSYIGDASVGAGANIGAGTITCNYDGFAKHRTKIGAGASVGSNTALVAPVSVGRGAITAAGSVITENVAPNALALARSRQTELKGWASRFRARKGKTKRD
jgi:bifunctional UDP-N-acetylglucosamine pyrophosphorylase / glucosamine-1-phosphate N-acetyltransferase